MRITVPHKQGVKNALHALYSLTSTTKMPILQNILLIGKGEVELVGTDLETTARLRLADTRIEGEGKMLLPASSLYEIFSKSNSDIVIEKQDNSVVVGVDSTKFGVPMYNSDNFPSYPSLEEKGPACIVSGDDLSQAVEDVQFAINTEKQTTPISGVHFKADSGSLCCEATNRYILAEEKIPCEGNGLDCVVGGKVLRLALKFWKQNKVQIFSTSRNIAFSTPHATVFGQLIEGRFPDTKSMFSQKPKLVVSIEKEKLFEVLERIFIIAKQGYTNRVTWHISNDHLRITAQNDMGTATSKIGDEVVKITQKENLMPFTISMDCSYILQILRRLTEIIKIGITSSTSPVLIKDNRGSNRYVLMPQATGDTDGKN